MRARGVMFFLRRPLLSSWVFIDRPASRFGKPFRDSDAAMTLSGPLSSPSDEPSRQWLREALDAWPKGFSMPSAIAELLAWMEDDHRRGGHGPLWDFEPSSSARTLNACPENGHREVHRLGLFAQDGTGSWYAVWDAGNGRYPVVFMDSEGTPFQVLAADAEDFLSLLAMGLSCRYGDISDEQDALPPADLRDEARDGPLDSDGMTPAQNDFLDGEVANGEFVAWVEARAGAPIPANTAPLIERLRAANLPSFYEWVCGFYAWDPKDSAQSATPFGLVHI